jgi:hypothetical protein
MSICPSTIKGSPSLLEYDAHWVIKVPKSELHSIMSSRFSAKAGDAGIRTGIQAVLDDLPSEIEDLQPPLTSAHPA